MERPDHAPPGFHCCHCIQKELEVQREGNEANRMIELAHAATAVIEHSTYALDETKTAANEFLTAALRRHKPMGMPQL